MSDTHQLKRGLKNRHVQLLAIGGAIGTGLFLGSGRAIHLAGPSIIFAYLITGVICFFIMRALGELLLSNLNHHSFIDFVEDYLGDRAAFITGWTYWFCWLFTSHGRLNGRRPLHAVLDTVAAPMDTSLTCSSRLAVNELDSCKIFWRNGILVCLD